MRQAKKYRGWLLAAPVFVTDPDGPNCTVESRYRWLGWWLFLNEWAHALAIFLLILLDSAWVPMWMLRIENDDSPEPKNVWDEWEEKRNRDRTISELFAEAKQETEETARILDEAARKESKK